MIKNNHLILKNSAVDLAYYVFLGRIAIPNNK